MTETLIPLDIAYIREDGIIESIKQLEPNNPIPVHSEGNIELAIEVNRGWFAENNVEVGDQLSVEYVIPNEPKEKYRSETGTIYDIISEVKDKKSKGSGTKDACYHKVKSRYSVWPSAYASGALVKCRKKGAANWGNSKKEDFSDWKTEFIWEDGDTVKKIEEASPAWQRKEGKSESGGLNKKGVASYRAANPGSKLKTAVTTKPSKLKKGSKAANRRKSFCARMKGMKKRLTSAKTARDPDSRINKSLRKWNC